MVQSLKFSCFEWNLRFNKFECADFKYDKSFFKFLPKRPKERIFGPELKGFFACMKLCTLKDSRMQTSNMILFFPNLISKFSKFYFWSGICLPFLFGIKLNILTNLSVLILNMTIAFKTCSPKNTQIRQFWSQIYAFLFLHKNLHFEIFKCTGFKYFFQIWT